MTKDGQTTRRQILGDAHVARAVAATDLDRDFLALLTDAAWGDVWSRGTIPPRERSMLTIELLASLDIDDELRLHLRATQHSGATSADDEALLRVAIYAGKSRANHAMRIAREILGEAQT